MSHRIGNVFSHLFAHKLTFILNVPFIGCVVLLVLFHAGVIERADQSGAEAVQSLADAIVICFTAISFEAATLDSKLFHNSAPY